MSNEQQVQEAIAALEEAMQAMRDYGLIIDGEDDE
jgi:hypothetical protein